MSFISIIENTFFAICRYWGSLHGSSCTLGLIQAMQTGINSADLNMVWSAKPLTREDAQFFPQIKKYYGDQGLPFWWWVFPSAKNPETLALLRAADYSFVSSTPCLLADLSLLPEGEFCDPVVTISQVRNREELALWREVSFAGFDFAPPTGYQYSRFTASFDLRADSPQKLFLAFQNGKPVATSLLFLTDSAAGIYFVTTLAEYRKKGIGLKLTRQTMRFAKMAGARQASLQSSPDGLRVYEQAGFKEYCRVDVYSLNPTSFLQKC